MSWSVSVIGEPDKIIAHLEDLSVNQGGQSKVEFDDVLPHLIGLVKQNFSDTGQDPPVLKLAANGHGACNGVPGATNSKQLYRNCNISLERFSTKIL
jgi:hypothetical protein